MAATKQVILGSGKLYIKAFNDGDTFTLSSVAVDDNLIGYIKGGASLEYTPTVYEVVDDLNVVHQKFLTKEAAVLRSGIMTWNVKTLKEIMGNGELAETTGLNTLKLGGNGARIMQKYAVVFVHERTATEAIRVGIVGTKDTALTLTFNPEAETVIDAEFTAVGHDSDGTLVIIEEDVAAASGA